MLAQEEAEIAAEEEPPFGVEEGAEKHTTNEVTQVDSTSTHIEFSSSSTSVQDQTKASKSTNF